MTFVINYFVVQDLFSESLKQIMLYYKILNMIKIVKEFVDAADYALFQADIFTTKRMHYYCHNIFSFQQFTSQTSLLLL
jgi:hypothetical protein